MSTMEGRSHRPNTMTDGDASTDPSQYASQKLSAQNDKPPFTVAPEAAHFQA